MTSTATGRKPGKCVKNLHYKVVAITTAHPRLRLNPYPTKYRLPGDLTPSRQSLPAIEGAVQRSIVHALTFHEIPCDIDSRIEQLPSEKDLNALTTIQKSYLTFTVFSLKQMVASGALTAEMAWEAFFREWQQTTSVEPANFARKRADFFQQFRVPSAASVMLNPPEWEFFLRAGEAGLAQSAHFASWELTFVDSREPEPVQSEFRKAIWLEMKLLEARVGKYGFTPAPVTHFQQSRRSYYTDHPSGEKIFQGGISLFGFFSGTREVNDLDISLKAELGHWMFGALCSHKGSTWDAELMDRMNLTGYTRRVNAALALGPSDGTLLPPECAVFLSGGYFGDSSIPRRYVPTYPEKLKRQEVRSYKDNTHAVAEMMERKIRESIIRAVRAEKIPPDRAYDLYNQMMVYMVLLGLEGFSAEAALEKIKTLDLEEIRAYGAACIEKASTALGKKVREDPSVSVRSIVARGLGVIATRNSVPILQDALQDPFFGVRGAAAIALLNILRPSPDSAEFKKLEMHRVVQQEKLPWNLEVFSASPGEAIPLLELILHETLASDIARGEAARLLIFLKRMVTDTAEFDTMHVAHLFFSKRADRDAQKQIISLGSRGIQALHAIYEMGLSPSQKIGLIGILGEMSTAESTRWLEEMLHDPENAVRGAAAAALMKIHAHETGSPEYARLAAFVEIKNRGVTKKLLDLGAAAIPALQAASEGADERMKREAGKFLAQLSPSAPRKD